MTDNHIVTITPQQRRRSIKFATVAAISGIAGFFACQGNVLTLLALKFGAKELYLGLLTFVTIAPCFCSFFTMSAIERIGKRRVLVFWHSITVFCLLPLLFIPFLASRFSPHICLTVILLVALLRAISDSLGSTGWFPILQDIVPHKITGRFFAFFNTSWQISAFFVTLLAAALLRGNPSYNAFEVLFAIAIVAFIIRALALSQMAENEPQPEYHATSTIITRFREILKYKNMKWLIFYIVTYIFAACVAEPFKIKLLKDLGFSYGIILAATSMVNLGGILTLRFWGKLADKFGNRHVFTISHGGMILATLPWVLISKDFKSPILIFALYLTWSIFHFGNNIAQTRYLLQSIPANKQNFINIINILNVFTAASAPLIAGIFLRLTQDLRINLPHFTIDNYHILFLVTAAMFLIPHSIRHKIRSTGETPTMQVIAIITRPMRNLIGPFLRLPKN